MAVRLKRNASLCEELQKHKECWQIPHNHYTQLSKAASAFGTITSLVTITSIDLLESYVHYYMIGGVSASSVSLKNVTPSSSTSDGNFALLTSISSKKFFNKASRAA